MTVRAARRSRVHCLHSARLHLDFLRPGEADGADLPRHPAPAYQQGKLSSLRPPSPGPSCRAGQCRGKPASLLQVPGADRWAAVRWLEGPSTQGAPGSTDERTGGAAITGTPSALLAVTVSAQTQRLPVAETGMFSARRRGASLTSQLPRPRSLPEGRRKIV